MTVTEAGRSTITIRRPTAPRPEPVKAPTFKLGGPVAGRTIGLRTDGAWRSWVLIAGAWDALLREAGAETLSVETNAQVGSEGRHDRDNIAEWSDQIDGGIVGLGTCGSCTSFSVHDAVTLEAHSKPSVVVVTSEFETHARNMASFLGHGDLEVLVLPYPLEARPDGELREIAVEYYPRALELLGATERSERAAARTVRPSEGDHEVGAGR
ncbi:MAG: hypothetical protein WEC34_06580 [Acidimicrobiia bacterium]